MAFVFLIQFTVVKMENLEYRLLSLIYFMIMMQLFPLVFVFLWDCSSTKSQCSTVVRTVVRATQQVNGKWQFWGCQNSVTPEPID